MKESEIKKNVREKYGYIAETSGSCCSSASSCGCGAGSARDISQSVGYTEEDLNAVPEGANLGLGCGNPIAMASLKPGETVIDLGSGAGFDSFLAAGKVGPSGRVIGVDMTPEMLARARENAEKGSYGNVEFRLGEIENLPVADSIADIIISNCVINLAPDKPRVFREAFRALKPGGRIMVSDIVLKKKLPEKVLGSVMAYVGCIAGAVEIGEYFDAIESAGFAELRVQDEASFVPDINAPFVRSLVETFELTDEEINDTMGAIRSVKVSAVKPT